MNTQLVSGSKLALALAISAVLGACGGGGGGDSSTPATPVATNGSGSTTTSTAGGTTTATNSTPAATTPATTAPSTPATTLTATTPATNSPVATAPAATASTPASNTQGAALINRAMYEQMRRDCQTPSRSFDPATGAECAAGVFVGKDRRDGATDCTVKLAKDGEVAFTVGDKVHVYKMTQLFRAIFLDSADQDSPYLFAAHIVGHSADDAAKKVHGFKMTVFPTSDGVNLPADFQITYAYGDRYWAMSAYDGRYELTADEKTVCTFPL